MDKRTIDPLRDEHHELFKPCKKVECYHSCVRKERVVREFNGLVDATGAEILASLEGFSSQLRERNIYPPKGSILHNGLDALRAIGQAQDGQHLSRSPTPTQLTLGMGTYFLIDAIRTLIEKTPTALEGMWQVFRGPDVLLTGRSNRTRERDRMFEMFMGAVATGFSAKVELRGSSNPDVYFTYGGKRIGFECKALYGSADRNKVRKVIKQKEEQIRKRNPDIDHAWIALDLTATFSGHDVDWFRVSGGEAQRRLQRHVFEIKDHLLSDGRLCAKLRASSSKVLGIVFVAHSACLAADRMTFIQVVHKLTLKSVRPSRIS